MDLIEGGTVLEEQTVPQEANNLAKGIWKTTQALNAKKCYREEGKGPHWAVNSGDQVSPRNSSDAEEPFFYLGLILLCFALENRTGTRNEMHFRLAFEFTFLGPSASCSYVPWRISPKGQEQAGP